ncbi:MAG: hypothetical protein ACRD24_04195 [Terriglobales bacterium]
MRLTIDKLIYGGDGLARLPADERGPGKAVFLPFVLDGELVEAESRGREARIRAGARQRHPRAFAASHCPRLSLL